MCEIVEVVCSKRSSVSFVTTVDTATSAIEGLFEVWFGIFCSQRRSLVRSMKEVSVFFFVIFALFVG